MDKISNESKNDNSCGVGKANINHTAQACAYRRTRTHKGVKMKVTTYCINKGRPSQYFGLKNARSGDVLYSAPNNWKTEKGALNWAIKHGFKVSKK